MFVQNRSAPSGGSTVVTRRSPCALISVGEKKNAGPLGPSETGAVASAEYPPAYQVLGSLSPGVIPADRSTAQCRRIFGCSGHDRGTHSCPTAKPTLIKLTTTRAPTNATTRDGLCCSISRCDEQHENEHQTGGKQEHVRVHAVRELNRSQDVR